jgi:plasmid maintenance system antidote protein VapI
MTVANLLDQIISANGLKNDAALSRALAVNPPVISKLRSGALPLGDSMIVKIHLVFDIGVRGMKSIAHNAAAEVRELAAA